MDGKKRYFFCPCVEADLNTEGLESASFERSSIVRKFTLYLEIERQQLYRTHFGFPNMLVDLLWESGEFPMRYEELDDTAAPVYEGI